MPIPTRSVSLREPRKPVSPFQEIPHDYPSIPVTNDNRSPPV